MLNYSFSLPTAIHFGAGVSCKAGSLAKELSASRVLIVADKGVISAGLTKAAEQSIKDEGLYCTYFDKVVPNPRDYHCQEGYEFAKSENIDCIVAVGGGSSMDTAKVIGTLLTHGRKPQDWCGSDKLLKPITPVIAIPTTAGTGSEVTPFAVVNDSETHVKLNIFDAKAAPKAALVDPAMLYGLPDHIMASTGIDALTHAVEAYTCKLAVPHTDAYAIYAAKLIADNLLKAIHDRTADACEGMMLGSTLAGIAFGYSDVAAVHCMAEALGGRYDLPHGVANAILLPTVTEFNVSAAPEKYADIARALGADTRGMSASDAAAACVPALREFCRSAGIPAMKDITEINPDDFKDLAVAAEANVSTPSNPRTVTAADFEELFRKAYYES